MWLKGIIRAVFVIVLLWVLLRWFEWKTIYFPRKELLGTPADMGLSFDDIEFVSEDDHTLHGWWVPHEEATATILYCHGNAGNISDRLPLIRDLHAMGISVFIFDYRGYGKSGGLSSEKGLYRDASAAYEWIRTVQYNDAENPPIFVYGRSLGGAVALEVACRKPVAGVILENTFTSIPDMAHHMYGLRGGRLLLTQQFDSRSKLATIQAPLLIAHGCDDDLVPFNMGKQLFQRAVAPDKQFVPLVGGHNDAGWHTTPKYGITFRRFLSDHSP
jgi:hypothetical protein